MLCHTAPSCQGAWLGIPRTRSVLTQGLVAKTVLTGFHRVQEMLMFLVATVCIIYIPHLLESYCGEEQLPGVAE